MQKEKAYVCKTCHRETTGVNPTHSIMQLQECYFCHNTFTTTHIAEYNMQVFENPDSDDLVVFTKIRGGLYVLFIEGDDTHSTRLTVDDYEWIPEVFRVQLEEIGFV